MEDLRGLFPDGLADTLNVAIFSTSGTHGSYVTIEALESSLKKYGNDYDPAEHDGIEPDDWYDDRLTVLVLQPRCISVAYGDINVTLEDIPWLKRLRLSSQKVLSSLGGG